MTFEASPLSVGPESRHPVGNAIAFDLQRCREAFIPTRDDLVLYRSWSFFALPWPLDLSQLACRRSIRRVGPSMVSRARTRAPPRSELCSSTPPRTGAAQVRPAPHGSTPPRRTTGDNGSSRHVLALLDSRSRRISEQISGLLIREFGNRPKLGGFIRNMSAVDRGAGWRPGNSKHGQCGLCDRGCHQCSSSARRTETYLW
jgi:hypothetical protein